MASLALLVFPSPAPLFRVTRLARLVPGLIMAETSTPTSSPSRFKAEMPDIPGIARQRRRNPLLPLVCGIAILGALLLLAVKWFSRPAKVLEHPAPVPTAQIEVPSPSPDPNSLLPHADQAHPAIAQVANLSKPWSSADFFIDGTPATIIRLPGGSPTAASGYWAFSRKAAYADCQLEYITDLNKLRQEYEFRQATHPLVGNPCSRTLYDPTKTVSLPGNIWIRGAIVQGSDIRPPLGVEIKIQGKQILAVRTE
jgi:hypothetical protein